MIDNVTVLHFITTYGTTESRKQIEVMSLSSLDSGPLMDTIAQLTSEGLIITSRDEYTITDKGRAFLSDHPSDIAILKCVRKLTNNDNSLSVSRDQILSCFNTQASSNVRTRLLEMTSNTNEVLLYETGDHGGFSINTNASYFKSPDVANWFDKNTNRA